MGSAEFRFQQFTIRQPRAALRVGTDGVLLGAWAGGDPPRTVLDIGTGTGLIALMMAQRFPLASVHAVEIEEGARLDAFENFKVSPWADRLHLVGNDISEFAQSQPSGIYDLIVCNPPYFRDSMPSADRPALMARHQGEMNVHQLFAAVRHLLAEDGTFSMVYPYQDLAVLQTEASNAGLFMSRCCSVRTKPEKPWSRVLTEWSLGQETTIHEQHVLMEQEGRGYSQEHLLLTKGFYLGQ